MAGFLLVDLDAMRGVTVYFRAEDGTLSTAGPLPLVTPTNEQLLAELRGAPSALAWPMSHWALAEFRWYLEDYLQTPYGAYEDRAQRVAKRLGEWGRAAFMAVFGDDAARQVYDKAREGERRPRLIIRAASPRLLELPWELMQDPERLVPLAAELSAFDRGVFLPDSGPREPPPPSEAGDVLRVLMVIARPAGSQDIGLQMIARPLLERAGIMKGSVEFRVLRPPTLAQLTRELAAAAAAGRPFDVVHFDVHGALNGRALLFEKEDGGGDVVSVQAVTRSFQASGVPLVVLNACRSGAIGKDLEDALATGLLREGAGSVVAMAYNMYDVKASEFMAWFYERLVAGDKVSEAVTAGRRRLFLASSRASRAGQRSVADWVIPVHYSRNGSEVWFSGISPGQPGGSSSAAGGQQELLPDGRRDLEPVTPFAGRDAEISRLERAVRVHRVVLAHGPAGVGKTELAKAFGRWWRDTGGAGSPEWIFWRDFGADPAPASAAAVIEEIGRRLFGAGFTRHKPAEREEMVGRALDERRLLLIWDDFESAAAVRAADEEPYRDELARLVRRIAAGGSSALIITSRRPQEWLGDVFRLMVGPLRGREVLSYTGSLVALYPEVRQRDVSDVAELMLFLDGHPLSMRLVLPQLAATSPEALLDWLTGATGVPDSVTDSDVLSASLMAGLSSAHAGLSQRARRLLPVVCLCQGVADVLVLDNFSGAPTVPEQFRGVSHEEWLAVLGEATRSGLLRELWHGMYRCHPALPAYLAALSREEDEQQYRTTWEQGMAALLWGFSIHADLMWDDIISGDSAWAYSRMRQEWALMTALLGYALDHQKWTEARNLAWPLEDFLTSYGRTPVWEAWIARMLSAVQGPGGTPPEPGSDAELLWLFALRARRSRLIEADSQDAADLNDLNEVIVNLEHRLEVAGPPRSHGPACYSLGLEAFARSEFDEARRQFERAVAAFEEAGDQKELGRSYESLGKATFALGQDDLAGEMLRKALTISEAEGDKSTVSSACSGLGDIAFAASLFDEAEGWYHRSLAVAEEALNHSLAASACLLLGYAAEHNEGRADLVARGWFHKTLAICERFGNKGHAGLAYSALGRIARKEGHDDQALDWFSQCASISAETGDKSQEADACLNAGLVALRQGYIEKAGEWLYRSAACSEETGDRHAAAVAYQNLAATARAAGRLDEAEAISQQALDAQGHEPDNSILAAVYWMRGSIAVERGQLIEARDWYLKSLAVSDEDANRFTITGIYSELADIAYDLGRPDEAADWRGKFAATMKTHDERLITASAYLINSQAAEEEGLPGKALDYLIRGVGIFGEEAGQTVTLGLHDLARLSATLAPGLLDTLWLRANGSKVPAAVRDYLNSRQPFDE